MLRFSILIGAVCLALALSAQTDKKNALIGRWEVISYAEQGVQVDKKSPALSQAQQVYRHVREDRVRFWYGYDSEHEQSRKRMRAYE